MSCKNLCIMGPTTGAIGARSWLERPCFNASLKHGRSSQDLAPIAPVVGLMTHRFLQLIASQLISRKLRQRHSNTSIKNWPCSKRQLSNHLSSIPVPFSGLSHNYLHPSDFPLWHFMINFISVWVRLIIKCHNGQSDVVTASCVTLLRREQGDKLSSQLLLLLQLQLLLLLL